MGYFQMEIPFLGCFVLLGFWGFVFGFVFVSQIQAQFIVTQNYCIKDSRKQNGYKYPLCRFCNTAI